MENPEILWPGENFPLSIVLCAKQVDALLALEDALVSQSLFVQKPQSMTISLKKQTHAPS